MILNWKINAHIVLEDSELYIYPVQQLLTHLYPFLRSWKDNPQYLPLKMVKTHWDYLLLVQVFVFLFLGTLVTLLYFPLQVPKLYLLYLHACSWKYTWGTNVICICSPISQLAQQNLTNSPAYSRESGHDWSWIFLHIPKDRVHSLYYYLVEAP